MIKPTVLAMCGLSIVSSASCMERMEDNGAGGYGIGGFFGSNNNQSSFYEQTIPEDNELDAIDLLGDATNITDAIVRWSDIAKNMNPFSDLSEGSDLPNAVQMMALVKSFAVHMCRLMREDDAPEIFHFTNEKYAHSVYSVIVSEMVRAFFKVNPQEKSARYGEDELMTFSTEENYKEMKDYDGSNFNYLFLMNLFDWVISYERTATTDAFDNLEEYLKNELPDYADAIHEARNDIQYYMETLKLFDFIEQVKQSKLPYIEYTEIEDEEESINPHYENRDDESEKSRYMENEEEEEPNEDNENEEYEEEPKSEQNDFEDYTKRTEYTFEVNYGETNENHENPWFVVKYTPATEQVTTRLQITESRQVNPHESATQQQTNKMMKQIVNEIKPKGWNIIDTIIHHNKGEPTISASMKRLKALTDYLDNFSAVGIATKDDIIKWEKREYNQIDTIMQKTIKDFNLEGILELTDSKTKDGDNIDVDDANNMMDMIITMIQMNKELNHEAKEVGINEPVIIMK